MGFTGSSVVKCLLANSGHAGYAGLIPGPGRSPGGGNTFQCSCLEIPCTEEPGELQSMEVAKSKTRLSTHARHIYLSIQIEASEAERENSFSFSLLSVQAFNELDESKTHWREQSCLSLPIQTLVSSRNTFLATPENNVQCLTIYLSTPWSNQIDTKD